LYYRLSYWTKNLKEIKQNYSVFNYKIINVTCFSHKIILSQKVLYMLINSSMKNICNNFIVIVTYSYKYLKQIILEQQSQKQEQW
jgi:hypothetical protein